MVQIKITDDLDVVVSEPNDTPESSFNYLVKQGRNSYAKTLKPFDNYGCFIWINGVYYDCIDKDAFSDEDFAIDVIENIKKCKTIEDLLDFTTSRNYHVSKNPYDLIEDYEMTPSVYTQEEIDALKKLPEDELKKELKKYIYAFFIDFGAYVAFIYD